MLILGIDQGIANLGWSILMVKKDKFKVLKRGIINTEASKPICWRTDFIYKELQKVIKPYRTRIKLISVEKLNGGLVRDVQYVNGIISLIGNICKCSIVQNIPASVKKQITGDGKADKNKMIYFIENKFNIVEKNDHIADSIAIAITGYLRIKNDKKEKTKYEKEMKKWSGI